jgi:hypothetical protein
VPCIVQKFDLCLAPAINQAIHICPEQNEFQVVRCQPIQFYQTESTAEEGEAKGEYNYDRETNEIVRVDVLC